MPNAKVAGLAVTLSAVLPLMANAAIPTATCRSTDRPETGISGDTTAAERDAGLPMQGFKCNTDLVGQYQGEGASWQLTAWKNCAYFDQRHPASANPSGAVESDAGTVVVDVSDPTHPRPTAWLLASAMIDPWESLKVNPTRQLLGGGQRPLNAASPADGFSVYDISTDCKAPVQKSDVHLPGSFGHSGQWAPDGKTFYITPLRNAPSIVAVNVDDAAAPFAMDGGIFTFSSSIDPDGGVHGPQYLPLPRLHDLEFTNDGNTAYITMFGTGATAAGNGFAVLDVSDFQQRRPNPQYRVVSSITWDDGSIGAQNALPIKVNGKPYIVMADEGGGGATGCASGKSANGFPRLIDVSDPTHPTVAAEIRLGVAEPANCAYISTAPTTSTLQTDGGVLLAPGFFAHSCHYCQVDDADDARILACNCFAAGLRFWDIHDITSIKEMAYYKPPAQGAKVLPGSQYANSNTPSTFVRMYDWATSKPSFPKDRGADAGDVWTTSQDNGFQVISLYSKVTVAPSSITVDTNKSTTLVATVDGAAKTGGVTWSVQPATGATVANGVFTATAAGTYQVIATSVVDRTKSGAASVVANTPGGCNTTASPFAGLLPIVALIGWLLWRRRTSPAR